MNWRNLRVWLFQWLLGLFAVELVLNSIFLTVVIVDHTHHYTAKHPAPRDWLYMALASMITFSVWMAAFLVVTAINWSDLKRSY